MERTELNQHPGYETVPNRAGQAFLAFLGIMVLALFGAIFLVGKKVVDQNRCIQSCEPYAGYVKFDGEGFRCFCDQTLKSP